MVRVSLWVRGMVLLLALAIVAGGIGVLAYHSSEADKAEPGQAAALREVADSAPLAKHADAATTPAGSHTANSAASQHPHADTPKQDWKSDLLSHVMHHMHGHDSVKKAQVTVGQKVPDFAVINLDGSKSSLSAIQKDAKPTQKRVVLLTFWCSFCGSCRRVEHNLDNLAREFQGKAVILALDASAGETAETVRAFAKKHGLTVPIVLDPSGQTADLFGTDVTTTTVVIDGEGVLRYCGRFNDGNHSYGADALKSVLAGEEVKTKTTELDG